MKTIINSYCIINLLIILTITGCGTRFGYTVSSGYLKVETTPPGLYYYIIDLDVLKYFPENTNRIEIGSQASKMFEQFLATQRPAIYEANISWIEHEIGDYELVLVCKKNYQAIRIPILPNKNEPLKISCQ